MIQCPVLIVKMSLDKFEIKVISTRWGNTPMDALNYDKPFHKWIVDNIILDSKNAVKIIIYKKQNIVQPIINPKWSLF